MSATQEHVMDTTPRSDRCEIDLNGSKDLRRCLSVSRSPANYIHVAVRAQMQKRDGDLRSPSYNSLAYAAEALEDCVIHTSKSGSKTLFVGFAGFPLTDAEATQLVERFGFREDNAP